MENIKVEGEKQVAFFEKNKEDVNSAYDKKSAEELHLEKLEKIKHYIDISSQIYVEYVGHLGHKDYLKDVTASRAETLAEIDSIIEYFNAKKTEKTKENTLENVK